MVMQSASRTKQEDLEETLHDVRESVEFREAKDGSSADAKRLSAKNIVSMSSRCTVGLYFSTFAAYWAADL
jgi:hypothetical protein